MRETIKRLIRISAGYSLVALVGPVFTLLLTPLYTKVLEPADYGVIDVALTIGSILTILMLLGMDQAVTAYYFQIGESEKRDLFTTAFGLLFILSVSIIALVVLFARPLGAFLFNDPARDNTLRLAALNALSLCAVMLAGTWLRLRMDLKRVNALAFASLFAMVALNVFFVLIMRYKAMGVIAANTVANTIAATVGLALVIKLFSKFSRAWIKPLLTTGLGIVPGIVGYIALANADRIMLTQYVSPHELGLYSTANKLASMCYVIMSIPWSAWWPIALEMGNKPDAPKQYARMLEYFAAASMFVSLLIGLFAPTILLIFTRAEYVPAAPYVIVLLMYVGPINLATQFFNIGLFVGKKTHLMSVVFIVAACVNISLNLLWDGTYGAWGAAWATVIAGVVQLALTFYFSRRTLFVDYRWVRLTTLLTYFLLTTLLFLSVDQMQSIALRLLALLAFIVTVFGVGILSTRHVELAWSYIQRRIIVRL
jgi:O-antigen/teichoic acid export membrane protein